MACLCRSAARWPVGVAGDARQLRPNNSCTTLRWLPVRMSKKAALCVAVLRRGGRQTSRRHFFVRRRGAGTSCTRLAVKANSDEDDRMSTYVKVAVIAAAVLVVVFILLGILVATMTAEDGTDTVQPGPPASQGRVTMQLQGMVLR